MHETIAVVFVVAPRSFKNIVVEGQMLFDHKTRLDRIDRCPESRRFRIRL